MMSAVKPAPHIVSSWRTRGTQVCASSRSTDRIGSFRFALAAVTGPWVSGDPQMRLSGSGLGLTKNMKSFSRTDETRSIHNANAVSIGLDEAGNQPFERAQSADAEPRRIHYSLPGKNAVNALLAHHMFRAA